MNNFRTITVKGEEGDWKLLEGKKHLATPQGRDLVVPSLMLAEGVAEEWRTIQHYNARAMPLTAMSYSAIDVIPKNFERMVDALMAYADTDLLFYRSEMPELRRKQEQGWEPILDWFRDRFECELHVTEGVMPIEQPYASLARIRRLLQALDPFRMSAFTVMTQSLGSIVLAVALKDMRINGAEGFRLSRIDEDFQAEQWGEDSIALARAREIERDIHAAERFYRLMEGGIRNPLG